MQKISNQTSTQSRQTSNHAPAAHTPKTLLKKLAKWYISCVKKHGKTQKQAQHQLIEQNKLIRQKIHLQNCANTTKNKKQAVRHNLRDLPTRTRVKQKFR